MRYAVNVRTLAEFALEGGDLAVDSALAERMREGMEGHLALQRQLDESWRTEEPLQIEAEFGDLTLRIQGRADAVRRWAGDPILEEIKTTRRDPARIAPNDYPVHWAQAEIYAAILCRKEGFPQCEVALVYFHPSGARSRLARLYTASELWERLLEYAAPYARWLMALEVWRGKFLIIECFTDNKNRTAADIRSFLKRSGGDLGATGSVSFLFDRVGIIKFKKDGINFDDLFEEGINAGADEIEDFDDEFEITCSVENFS